MTIETLTTFPEMPASITVRCSADLVTAQKLQKWICRRLQKAGVYGVITLEYGAKELASEDGDVSIAKSSTIQLGEGDDD